MRQITYQCDRKSISGNPGHIWPIPADFLLFLVFKKTSFSVVFLFTRENVFFKKRIDKCDFMLDF